VASYDEVVPPGQVGKIRARLSTGHGRGAQAKVVSVTTNDPDQPNTNLTLRAYIEGSVLFLPGEAINLFSRAETVRPGRVIVRKDPTEKGDLEIADLSSSAPWIAATARRVEVEEPPSDGLPAASPGDWVIEARVAGNAPTGNRRETIRFRTGLTREPRIELPVTAFIPADLTLSPPQLELRAAEGVGAAGSAVVLLRAGLDRSGITISVAPADFQATIEPAGPTNARLQVRWEPGGPTGATDGQVTVRLGEKTAVLPVRVSVARSAAPAAPR
jgi:hypothetical protein